MIFASSICGLRAMNSAEDSVAGVIAMKWRTARIQARDRLFYVRPGEVPLLVLNDPAGAARDAGRGVRANAPGRWYDTLWGSVAAADSESAKAE